MALRHVLIEWLDQGVEPDGTSALSADDQRHLVADICTAEPDFLTDAFCESVARYPTYSTEIISALRSADALQMFAVMDRVFRGYLIGSSWLETELREVQEQEAAYDGDQ